MELITTITEKDFGRSEKLENRQNYPIRAASRAILFDENSRIALINVTKYGYFKLPGGGVEDDEDISTTLARELREEVGTTAIEVIAELGEVDEYRDAWEVKATHYGFVVRSTGPLTETSRTPKEIAHGMEVVWANDIGRGD